MMPPKKGVLAEEAEAPLPGDPSTPDDSSEHEGAESSDFEGEEMAAEGEPGEGKGQEKAYTKEDQELFDLVVGRTLGALAKSGDDLDKAMQADPIRATVEFGTSALRTVAMGANDAGKPISFEILIQAGMQVIKELAGIANDKGYLPDEGIETFLKEAFQQSLSKYTKMDADEGMIDPKDLEKAKAFANPGQEAQAKAGAVDQVQGRVTPNPGALAQAKGSM